MDRAYIDYGKFEEMTERGVTYVTNIKKNLSYECLSDTLYQTEDGRTEVRVQEVVFRKQQKGENKEIVHNARIVTYADDKTGKGISLLTNDKEIDPNDINGIYRHRWQIELLFKQIKQIFPLRYFFGESANAIKIQIWATLIANLLLSVLRSRIKRSLSFSELATLIRLLLMQYLVYFSLFNELEKDWQNVLKNVSKSPPLMPLFE